MHTFSPKDDRSKRIERLVKQRLPCITCWFIGVMPARASVFRHKRRAGRSVLWTVVVAIVHLAITIGVL
jgi:hypothetical protein